MKKAGPNFCWDCGNKLWGNHKKELFIDGHKRTLHKSCAKVLERDKDHEFCICDDMSFACDINVICKGKKQEEQDGNASTGNG